MTDDFLDMLVEKGKKALESTLKPIVKDAINSITHNTRYDMKTGKFTIGFRINGKKVL